MRKDEKWERYAVGYAFLAIVATCIGLALIYAPLVFLFAGFVFGGLAWASKKLADESDEESE